MLLGSRLPANLLLQESSNLRLLLPSTAPPPAAAALCAVSSEWQAGAHTRRQGGGRRSAEALGATHPALTPQCCMPAPQSFGGGANSFPDQPPVGRRAGGPSRPTAARCPLPPPFAVCGFPCKSVGKEAACLPPPGFPGTPVCQPAPGAHCLEEPEFPAPRPFCGVECLPLPPHASSHRVSAPGGQGGWCLESRIAAMSFCAHFWALTGLLAPGLLCRL